MATTVRGVLFYLYLIMDRYSRNMVGWEVYATESVEQAARVIQKAHRRPGVPAGTLVLHADKGSPMKGGTMLATRQRLGVVPAFSRPAVSNDHPDSGVPVQDPQGPPQLP